MPQIICVWLQDGRSLVASCQENVVDRVKKAFLDREASITFTGEESVETLPTALVHSFAIADKPIALSKSASIFHYVAV